MILKLCTTDIIKLNSCHPYPAQLRAFQVQLPFSFALKNELSFCCCFIMNKEKEQIQQIKCEFISKATYAKPRNVRYSISLYSVKGLTQKLLISV